MEVLRRLLKTAGLLKPIRRYRWSRRVYKRRRQQNQRFSLSTRQHLPKVFANGMAKSGSHILEQYLEGLEKISPLVFTDIHPIRTYNDEGKPRAAEKVLLDLGRLEAGDMAWGYLPAREPYLSWLGQLEMASYFVYRDPRDRIISHIFYASDIHEGHAMRDYYRQIESMEQKINDTIRGVPGLIENVTAAYESYLGWFDVPSVLKIRFEDLVNDKRQTIDKLLDHLTRHEVELAVERNEAIERLVEEMAPKHSPTFRAGKSGGWRKHFTEANKEIFKEVAGDLLIQLGYESSYEW